MQIFYPQIVLEDVGYFYDLDTFNRCEEEGCHCHDDDCHCHEDGCHCHDDE